MIDLTQTRMSLEDLEEDTEREDWGVALRVL